MKVPGFVVYVLALLPVWAVASGSLHPTSLLLGLLVAAATAPVTWRILEMPQHIEAWVLIRRLLRFFGYFVTVFVPDALRSGIDVARRVLNPVVPVFPGIVAVKIDTDSAAQVLLAADHITLTPGQLVVDIDPERKILYIHCMDLRDEVAVRRALDEILTAQRRVLE